MEDETTGIPYTAQQVITNWTHAALCLTLEINT